MIHVVDVIWGSTECSDPVRRDYKPSTSGRVEEDKTAVQLEAEGDFRGYKCPNAEHRHKKRF